MRESPHHVVKSIVVVFVVLTKDSILMRTLTPQFSDAAFPTSERFI
jgi:hypothetical protein